MAASPSLVEESAVSSSLRLFSSDCFLYEINSFLKTIIMFTTEDLSEQVGNILPLRTNEFPMWFVCVFVSYSELSKAALVKFSRHTRNESNLLIFQFFHFKTIIHFIKLVLNLHCQLQRYTNQVHR